MGHLYRHPVILQLIALLAVHFADCQDWTWLGGDKMADRNTNNNHPGGRGGSSVWVDSNDKMWMFGGNGFSDLAVGKPHVMNDVWSFSLNKTKFELQHPGTWTSKPDATGQTLDVPDGRHHAAMCGDTHRLVMFGGFGEEGNTLGDLWTYDILTKVWFKVLNNDSDDGSLNSSPAARGHSSVWCYNSSMYLFGGMNNNKTVFKDMWKLHLSSLEWTKLSDNSEPAPESGLACYPAGRNGASTWLSNNVFYMFSGNTNSDFSYIFQHTGGLASDLWLYHPRNNTWQRVGNTAESSHHSGHSMDPPHTPGGRVGAGTWTDSQGNLWLFGGVGIDTLDAGMGHEKSDVSRLLYDVWRYHLERQNWALMGGHEVGDMVPKYGDLGKKTPTAFPGARTDMMVWQGQGNLAYLFGGLGHDGMNIDGYLNDLWSVDVWWTINREYMISPLSLFLFIGLGTSSLLVLLVLALCSRQKLNGHGVALRLKLNAEYTRVEAEDS